MFRLERSWKRSGEEYSGKENSMFQGVEARESIAYQWDLLKINHHHKKFFKAKMEHGKRRDCRWIQRYTEGF